MDGEQNGTQAQVGQQEQQTAQQQESQQAQGNTQTTPPDGSAGTGDDAQAYEEQLAQRDNRIAELEAQIAEAAKKAETADELRSEIAALKAQGESDRVDFQLQLAGCRNAKAARAVLEDHGGDVAALKEADPWLFGRHAAAEASGKTGLPNAGAAVDVDAQVKRWEKLAGLADE